MSGDDTLPLYVCLQRCEQKKRCRKVIIFILCGQFECLEACRNGHLAAGPVWFLPLGGAVTFFAVQSLSCCQVDVFGANLLNSDPQTFRFCIHLSEVWNLKRSCVREPSSITALFLISCGPAAIRITFNRTRRRRWILKIHTILLLVVFFATTGGHMQIYHFISQSPDYRLQFSPTLVSFSPLFLQSRRTRLC